MPYCRLESREPDRSAFLLARCTIAAFALAIASGLIVVAGGELRAADQIAATEPVAGGLLRPSLKPQPAGRVVSIAHSRLDLKTLNASAFAD